MPAWRSSDQKTECVEKRTERVGEHAHPDAPARRGDEHPLEPPAGLVALAGCRTRAGPPSMPRRRPGSSRRTLSRPRRTRRPAGPGERRFRRSAREAPRSRDRRPRRAARPPGPRRGRAGGRGAACARRGAAVGIARRRRRDLTRARGHVAGRLLALLDLDRGVVDAGVVPQDALDVRSTSPRARRRGANVDARRVQPRRQRPAVQVVDRLDARDLQDPRRAATACRCRPACPRAGCARPRAGCRPRAAGSRGRSPPRRSASSPYHPVRDITTAPTITATEPSASVSTSR